MLRETISEVSHDSTAKLNDLIKNEILTLFDILGIDTSQENISNIYQQTVIFLKNTNLELSLSKLSDIIFNNIKSTFNITLDINQDFSFNNFISDQNDPTVLAAKMVSEKPGEKSRNPLFLYNEDDCSGKTHLLQAIFNQTKSNFPDIKIHYFSTQKLVEEILSFLKKEDILNKFISNLRQLDMLLLDDIDFLSQKNNKIKPNDKNMIYNIFLDIFNEFHNNENKQIVFTSKVSPVYLDIPNNLLASRLKWGLNQKIKFPDIFMRTEFIKSCFEELNIILSKETLNEIIGGLLRLRTIYDIRKMINNIKNQYDSDPALVNIGFLSNSITLENKQFTPDEVISIVVFEVSYYFEMSRKSLAKETREREVLRARQIAMYLLKNKFSNNNYRNMPKISLAKIGKSIGGKDHATVIHSSKVINNLIETDKETRTHVFEIFESLKKKFGLS